MFDFLFAKAGGETQSIIEMITVNATKAQISDAAIEKANGMIAKAISKSEFVVQRNGERVKDDVYWMLNVKPNPNETATEFWIKSIKKVFEENECLIVHLNGNLYRASKFTVDKAVTKGKKYTDIYVEVADDFVSLTKTFKAEDVIHLRNTNKKIIQCLKTNLGIYNKIATGLLSSKKIGSVPKFTLDVETGTPIIRQKDEKGNEKQLTIDQYKKKIKELLESENIEVLTNQSGMKVNQLPIDAKVSTEDITKISKEIYSECAYAYDIPESVFSGTITEKADSTNEFITYAVNWLVEMLNDSMTAALVGKEAFFKGEKIWIDMGKFKHVDVIESAGNLDKLRAIGFTLDEIMELVGREPLNTNFSKERVVTKNYTNDLGGQNKE